MLDTSEIPPSTRYKILLDIGKHKVGKVSVATMYHVFPDKDYVQEEHFKIFNKRINTKLYTVKRIPQKDGSAFYGIWSKNTIYDVAHLLRELCGISIYTPVKMEPSSLIELIRDSLLKDIETGEASYVSYWTHTFLNGKRMLPVIIHHQAKSVFNLSPIFEALSAEDGFGVVVDDYMELELSSVIEKGYVRHMGSVSNIVADEEYGRSSEIFPEVIRYFSMVRMCSCCGVISNHGKALEKPWLDRMYRRTAKRFNS